MSNKRHDEIDEALLVEHPFAEDEMIEVKGKQRRGVSENEVEITESVFMMQLQLRRYVKHEALPLLEYFNLDQWEEVFRV